MNDMRIHLFMFILDHWGHIERVRVTCRLSRVNIKGRDVMYISGMKCNVHLPVREHPRKERYVSLESEDRVAKTLMFTIYVAHYTMIHSKSRVYELYKTSKRRREGIYLREHH